MPSKFNDGTEPHKTISNQSIYTHKLEFTYTQPTTSISYSKILTVIANTLILSTYTIPPFTSNQRPNIKQRYF